MATTSDYFVVVDKHNDLLIIACNLLILYLGYDIKISFFVITISSRIEKKMIALLRVLSLDVGLKYI